MGEKSFLCAEPCVGI
uniref:Uncharacterized protein n=1 Tax=Anguilla anguilla TaxID=7936 RepID=A0A0E9RL79_ANGAN